MNPWINLQNFFCFLTLSYFLVCSSLSHAGGGWEGGGEILGDRLNPWFLSNVAQDGQTREISYCMLPDPDFGIDLRTQSLLVNQAFKFWRDEFRTAQLPKNLWPGSKPVRVRVGGNQVREVACTQNPDLRIQFGYLDPEQLAFMEEHKIDRKKFVAFSQRNDDQYNSQDLSGRGFIYVSPDHGENAFEVKHAVPSAWTNLGTYRLRNVLVHELGHVFGLTHGGPYYELMSASFPEYTVSTDFPQPVKTDVSYLKLGPVFFPEEGVKFSACLPAEKGDPAFIRFEKIKEAFGFSESCLKVRHSFDGLELFVGNDLNSDSMHKHGLVKYEGRPEVRSEPLISVRLSDEQKIFPETDGGEVPKILLGPSRVEMQRSGSLYVDGKLLARVFVQLQAQRFQLGAAWKNEFMPDLFGQIDWPQGVMQSSGWGPIQYDFWMRILSFFKPL